MWSGYQSERAGRSGVTKTHDCHVEGGADKERGYTRAPTRPLG